VDEHRLFVEESGEGIDLPDADTRRSLTTYWRVILPGSALIRRGWLGAIRRRAEAEAAR
jgi:hypothetical protein